MKEKIKEEILQRFLNTDSGGAGGRNGLTQREKILLHIGTDIAFKNLAAFRRCEKQCFSCSQDEKCDDENFR